MQLRRKVRSFPFSQPIDSFRVIDPLYNIFIGVFIKLNCSKRNDALKPNYDISWQKKDIKNSLFKNCGQVHFQYRLTYWTPLIGIFALHTPGVLFVTACSVMQLA